MRVVGWLAIQALSRPSCCRLPCHLLLPQSHGKLAAVLSGLAREVQGDRQLAARIRAKYKIKNTVSNAAATMLATGLIECTTNTAAGTARCLVDPWCLYGMIGLTPVHNPCHAF
jgi:hypothetical protein